MRKSGRNWCELWSRLTLLTIKPAYISTQDELWVCFIKQNMIGVANLSPVLYCLSTTELIHALSYSTLHYIAFTRMGKVYFPSPFILNLAK